MDYPHYSRAPLIEAVIDIRAETSSGAIERLESLAASLKDDFPVQGPINQGQFELAFAPSEKATEPQVKSSTERLGFRLANQTAGRVLQLRTNGMTFSHLAPYSDWKTFSGEARRYWQQYCESAGPSQVVRLAVRYINRIDLPGDPVEPKDFFNLYPKTPEDIPTDITGMFLQLRMPQADIGAEAVINSALADSQRDDAISVVLDFDLFKQVALRPDAYDSAIWEELEALRERKNRLFNSCITEKTKELIR